MPLQFGVTLSPGQSHVRSLDPDAALFILVACEGPDRYSQAGGLGVRISGVARTLAELGYETHLFFFGDPALPAEERVEGERLTLHRWGQWISAYWPGGVYDGEWGKVSDLTASLPPYLVDRLVAPALENGRVPILMFEEWQTAECACRVAEMLRARGLRNRVLLAWNANHVYGFDRIDWGRLAAAAMITTVSRHMRSVIRCCGADAQVIPNGIPRAALAATPKRDVATVRSAIAMRPGAGLFFKMARWEREKGWHQALEMVARTRGSGHPAVLVARSGGPSGPGGELTRDAEQRGLRVATFETERAFLDGLHESVRAGTDVVNLRFGVSPELARTLYAAADGVLANSVSEPFGLVGLEAMAAGGVAYTGGTGEDYAVSGRNAIVLQTLDPGEIVRRWEELAANPAEVSRIRRSARRTARDYEWHVVVESALMRVLERQAQRQGICARPRPDEPSPDRLPDHGHVALPNGVPAYLGPGAGFAIPDRPVAAAG